MGDVQPSTIIGQIRNGISHVTILRDGQPLVGVYDVLVVNYAWWDHNMH